MRRPPSRVTWRLLAATCALSLVTACAAGSRDLATTTRFVVGPTHYAPEQLDRTLDGGLTWHGLPLPRPAPVSDALTPMRPPCDAGFGFPIALQGCPDPTPETGWLSQTGGGQLLFEPFRSLINDAEGRAYAESHNLDFPSPNDAYDMSIGSPRPLDLTTESVCTGVIQVGYREPLEDHRVKCDEFRAALRKVSRIPVAAWRDRGAVAQLSELYRP